ncbi:hypothetical protein [Virgisporangium aurantiacum]|uniref:Uncharacterized protein n=1 Tax=Virgisporangium aurantiacum TaxID=175570 RepID=A0A8J3YY76_9ACTN|nr:hypothetical protein [Virgisporangium aurantiacum]GIJ53911.1 hypothetical protein Vau01_014270 [Virgisporangium aurantiacum]
MTGAVLRDPHLKSVAVEIELARSGSRPPRIVVSIFNRDPLMAIFTDLAIEEARRVHAALGEALRLADETAR